MVQKLLLPILFKCYVCIFEYDPNKSWINEKIMFNDDDGDYDVWRD